MSVASVQSDRRQVLAPNSAVRCLIQTIDRDSLIIKKSFHFGVVSYKMSGFNSLVPFVLTPLAQAYLYMNSEDKALSGPATVKSKNPSYCTLRGRLPVRRAYSSERGEVSAG